MIWEIIKEKRQVEQEVIAQVVCNCCGRQLTTDENGYFEDFIHLEKEWGYFSGQDGVREEADICEDCWKQMKKMFRVSTEVEPGV